MEWLLEKNNFGYTLYEGRQINRRREKGFSYDYDFCVTDSTLALYLIKRHSQEIKEKISFQTENLNVAESELVNLIISLHNKE